MRWLRLPILLAVLSLTAAPAASAEGSVWTTPVTGPQAIDPRSAELVAGLVNTVNEGYAEGRPPWISVRKCAARIYTVSADQPTVRVSLLNADRPARASLQAALSAVPLPADAIPSDCPDATIVVEQPSTDRMWELWHARQEADGWHADWGGATEHMSTNIGSYGPSDWPGALTSWGVSASSMTLAPGIMRISELGQGEIDHAIALSLPQSAAGLWAWPAERTDGASTAPDALPYGARLRLDPSIDVDAMDAPAAAKVILHAIQNYGLIVREQTNYCVQLGAEAAPADDPDFYQRIFGGYPGPIMRAIPWQDMQVLRMNLFTKSGPVTIAPASKPTLATPVAAPRAPAHAPVRITSPAPTAGANAPTPTPRAPALAPLIASQPTHGARKVHHASHLRTRPHELHHRKRARGKHRRRRHAAHHRSTVQTSRRRRSVHPRRHVERSASTRKHGPRRHVL